MVNFSRLIFLLLVCSAYAKANSVVDYGPDAVLNELEEKGFSQLYAKFSEECPGAVVKGSLAAYPSRLCRHSAWSMWAWAVLNLHETSRDINTVKRHAATIQLALNRYQKYLEREASYKSPYQYSDLPMLIKRDQLWEMVALSKIDESYYEGLNDKGRHYFNHLADVAKLATYRKNQRILAELVEQHSWPTISEYGADISSDAWLIVQHSDHDVGFQRKMLLHLKNLLSTNETSKRNVSG